MRDIDETSLRDNVSLLPQKVFLFNASIEDNIRLANKHISDYEFALRLEYLRKIGLLDGIDIKQ